MPIDDIRWQDMFKLMLDHARQTRCEVLVWQGGNHWTFHNAGINFAPGWHQNKTLEPSMSGVLKAAAGVAGATLFSDGPGWAPSGTTITITVYARGYLAAPVTLSVAASSGSLSKTTVTLAAGANTQDTFTFTSASNTIATISYSVVSGGSQPPPARRVFSLSDPVAYAYSTHLANGAQALLAKYSACKWEVGEGFTDYMQGWPASAGEIVRAIADSGYGSSPGNAMEMLNWLNNELPMGPMVPPVMRVTNGVKNSDHSAPDTFGFWCRKCLGVPNAQPNPRNRVPYGIDEPHFAIVAAGVPGIGNTGVVFQASNSTESHLAEIGMANSQPQARWVDAGGATVALTAPTRLVANTPAVICLTSVPGAQRLRVNAQVVASAARTFVASPCDQLLLGSGFVDHSPRGGFGGNFYSAITGRGAPTSDELGVMERYLANTAGFFIP
jgi:endoglucanase